MRKGYVVYKGKRYNSGDKINIYWYTRGYKVGMFPYTGTFLDCDEEKDEYRIVVNGITYCYNKICFSTIMRDEDRVAKKAQPCAKKATFRDELNIDGLLIAWVWYIFIMVISTLFYDRIGLWIIATLVFLNYRNKKLKEAGHR